MNERERLMTLRHEAYVKAKASNFEIAIDTQAWRSANRSYVTERTRLKASAMGKRSSGRAQAA